MLAISATKSVNCKRLYKMKSLLILTLALIGSSQAIRVTQMQTQTSNDKLGSLSGVQFRLVDSNNLDCYTVRFNTGDGFDDFQVNTIVGADLGSCQTRDFASKIRDVYVIHDGADDWGFNYISVFMDDTSSCTTQAGIVQGQTNLPWPCT